MSCPKFGICVTKVILTKYNIFYFLGNCTLHFVEVFNKWYNFKGKEFTLLLLCKKNIMPNSFVIAFCPGFNIYQQKEYNKKIVRIPWTSKPLLFQKKEKLFLGVFNGKMNNIKL